MRGSNGRRAGEDTGHRAGWRGHDRSWLALRVAAVTAAVALIAGGGYGVSQLLSGGSTVNGAASRSGAAAPNFKEIPGPGPAPRMSAGGFNQAPGSASGASGSGNLSAIAPLVTASGTNYQPTSLGAQASTVLNRLTPGTHSSPEPLPTVAPAPDPARLFPHLRACLIYISHGQRRLLVDLAHYLGHPALIVVLSSRNGAPPKAEVIAPGCNATTAHILATAPLPH